MDNKLLKSINMGCGCKSGGSAPKQQVQQQNAQQTQQNQSLQNQVKETIEKYYLKNK